jgi:uridine kinase
MAERTPRVLLIDGRSGSGKTELARLIADDWPGAQLVRLDDLYPGWGGLEAGSAHVHDEILAAERPRWQRWDWAASALAQWHDLDPARPLVIEGAGVLTRRNRALAGLAVWVELDEPTRKTRALARDGATYAPHWEDWAAQETRFIARENPVALADVVVDGTDVTVAAGVWRRLADAARVRE